MFEIDEEDEARLRLAVKHCHGFNDKDALEYIKSNKLRQHKVEF